MQRQKRSGAQDASLKEREPTKACTSARILISGLRRACFGTPIFDEPIITSPAYRALWPSFSFLCCQLRAPPFTISLLLAHEKRQLPSVVSKPALSLPQRMLSYPMALSLPSISFFMSRSSALLLLDGARMSSASPPPNLKNCSLSFLKRSYSDFQFPPYFNFSIFQGPNHSNLFSSIFLKMVTVEF